MKSISSIKMFNFKIMASELLLASSFKSNEELCKMTFYQFAKNVLGKNQADLYGRSIDFILNLNYECS